MSRMLLAVLVAALFHGACAKKPPDLPVSADAAPVASQPMASSVSPNSAPVPSKSRPETTSPAPLAPPLRDLAARYLESDGRGGWRTSEQVAIELAKLPPEDVARLWPLMKDPQVEVRRGAAVFLLGQFNPSNREQVAAFMALLDDPDRMVRARALDAIKLCSRDDQLSVLPRLAAMLNSQREDRPENRAAIARVCSALRADAVDALAALEAAAANDPDAAVRSACLAAAAQIAAPQQSAILLSKALADRDAKVRLVAAARLRQLGAGAAPAADDLSKALADTDDKVAEAAAEALIRVGSPAVKPLAEQLSSNNAPARKLALACLAKLGPAAKPAAAAIEKCRQDSDPQVRQLAEAALMRLAGK